MLTEKAINDTLWCSVMWRDEDNNDKRLKPDRVTESTLQKICEAVIEGKSNNKAFIEETLNGFRAKPYEGCFWIVVPTRDTSMLLTLHEVLYEEGEVGWYIILKRAPLREPRDENGFQAEMLIRRLIARIVREYIPGETDIIVKTEYKNNPEYFQSGEPSEKEAEEADDFILKIQDYANGERRLEPQVEKCPICWFKECPRRIIQEEVEGTRAGKPHLNIL